MAPKKSAFLKNPISCRGSSSSSSLPARNGFYDLKSQKDFDENFCDRVIHLERQVTLSDFSDTPLPSAFSSRVWESLQETLEVSQRVYTEVLLQHTCYRYLYSSVYYDIQRNTYHSYSEAHFQGTTCS